MKFRLVLIVLTLALAANAVRLTLRSDEPGRVDAGLAKTKPAQGAVPAPEAKPEIPPAAWRALHSDDLGAFAANLRAAGFPEHVVRALIVAEIEERFRAREAALAPAKKTPYWQMDFTPEPLETRLARLDLKREKDRLRQQLLGPDPATAADELLPVAAEKRGPLRMLIEDYGALIADARSRAGANALASEKKELEFLQSEQKRELAALLTPQELADYEISRGVGGTLLRGQLRYFEPTDEEFRAIALDAQARREAANSLESRVISVADRQKQEEANLRRDAELKAVLGEQRFGEFQRARDADYRLLRDLNARAQLQPDSAALAYDLRTATLAAASRLADDKALSVDAKKAATAQLVENTRTQLNGILGADIGKIYLGVVEGQSSWLGAIGRGLAPTLRENGMSYKPIYFGGGSPPPRP